MKDVPTWTDCKAPYRPGSASVPSSGEQTENRLSRVIYKTVPTNYNKELLYRNYCMAPLVYNIII